MQEEAGTGRAQLMMTRGTRAEPEALAHGRGRSGARWGRGSGPARGRLLMTTFAIPRPDERQRLPSVYDSMPGTSASAAATVPGRIVKFERSYLRARAHLHTATCIDSLAPRKYVQSCPKKLVLGCVISPLRQQAESRNLMGHTFLAKSVVPFAFKL